jgi:hypothetical protein
MKYESKTEQPHSGSYSYSTLGNYNASNISTNSTYSTLGNYQTEQPIRSSLFITPDYGTSVYSSLQHGKKETGDTGYFTVNSAYGGKKEMSPIGWRLDPLTQKCEHKGFIGTRDVFNTFMQCAVHHSQPR